MFRSEWNLLFSWLLWTSVYLLYFCSHKKSYICHMVGLDTIKSYNIFCNTGNWVTWGSFAWSIMRIRVLWPLEFSNVGHSRDSEQPLLTCGPTGFCYIWLVVTLRSLSEPANHRRYHSPLRESLSRAHNTYIVSRSLVCRFFLIKSLKKEEL